MADDLEGYRAIRKFVCSCMCEFYLPDGIEPLYCPFCAGSVSEFKELLPDEQRFGYYTEGEE